MSFVLTATTSDDAIPEFKKKFGVLKSKFTTAENFLKNERIQVEDSELRSRILSLEKAFDDFNLLINSLTSIISETDITQFEDSFAEFENRFHVLIGKYNSLGNIDNESQTKNSIVSPNESISTKNVVHSQSLRLPEIKFPYFDGTDVTQWTTFRDTYTALIHNNDSIDDIIKFTYLIDKLRGDAKSSIGHITLSKTGYAKAWTTLTKIYDDHRVIIDKHIEALFDLEQVHKRKEVELRKLLNGALSHISSLSASGFELDKLSQAIVLKLVTRKLDNTTRGEWEESIEPNELPTWESFIEFLERKCRVLRESENSMNKSPSNSTLNTNSKISSKSNYHRNYHPKRESTFFANKATSSTVKCDICGKSWHAFFNCPAFHSLTPQQRYDKIKAINACINCLHPKHRVSDCKSMGCKLCRGRHHTLLHFDQTAKQKSEVNDKVDSSSAKQEESPTNNYHLNNDRYEKLTILPTAIVSIEDNNGRLFKCRALLDSGSQSNFINEEFVKKIKFINRNESNLTVNGLNGTKSTISQSISTTVHSKYKPFQVKLDFAITDKISDRIPSNSFDISRWQLPQNIELADPFFNSPAPIDILIGVEMFPEILLPNRLQLSPKLPSVQESMFGWIVFGKYEHRVEYNFSLTEINNTTSNEQLDQSIKKFWEIENIPAKRFLSEEEKKCESYFIQTTKREPNGRYTVSIPFRQPPDYLGDSKQNALKRFQYLERKLSANDDLKQPYVEFINEYLNLGHMKILNATCHDSNEPTYYMPHHAVLRPSSSSTKLRVVFDASAKTSSKKSLNELMLVGPTVQDNLFDIILRFRTHRFAMSSDVSKMYRQIQVSEKQTRLQRILWRENPNDQIDTYELTTVTYGTASAPYLATRTLNQLALDEVVKYPKASKVALKDFYVDDLITGCDDIDEAKQLQSEMINMLNSGGFNLHKWCANDSRLLENITTQDREELKFNEFSLGDCVKALGLLWQPKEDYFVFKPPKFENNKPVTKRTVVSDIAKLYDPLGFLSPVIIMGKIAVQNLWASKIDWDESIPNDLNEMWKNYTMTLSEISQIKINRNVMGHNKLNIITRTELHGYSDASEKAYGACLYIKTIDSNNKISVNLLCSKSRVAPLKTLSLPRLELSAALLLAKLTSSTIDALGLQFDEIILWSDSTITLCWIMTPPHKLKTFIANRVNEIQELTSNFTWKHVETANNPADLITRGVMPNELCNLNIWWHGPDMLQSNEYNSIITASLTDFDDKVSEIKQEKTSLLVTISYNVILKLIPKYESFGKLVRVLAYIMRFVNIIKKTEIDTTTYVTVTEIRKSTIRLIQAVQQESYLNEFKALKKGQDISPKSKLKSLHPFLDNDEIIRVGGRLSNAKMLNYNIKHQIVLPPNHILTKLIFKHEHKVNCHAGPQLILSIVRQNYWPIHGINTAKQTVKSCVPCFRVKPKVSEQLMGNLPSERFQSVKAFLNTGVDFCGPFFVKLSNLRKAQPQKMYVASFVCLCTKAVHLEIVQTLSTESFIECLKRFISRRGKINTIWSDNATNFRGAKNELRELYDLFNTQCEQLKIINFCTNDKIHWKLIPPKAPNFGGLWEASIKSFKTHLKRVMRDKTLKFEQFSTLIVQIEGILNSRPLTCMSTDPTDPEPLTPSHFLTGGPVSTIVEPSYNHINENHLSKWQEKSKMLESFWKRYSLEYLHSLQERSKWRSSKQNIKEGDVVLLVQENLPPTKWPLSIVVSTSPGLDGNARVVELQTVVDGIKKNFKRPITKICKLPINT